LVVSPYAQDGDEREELRRAAKRVIGLFPGEDGFDARLVEKFRNPPGRQRIAKLYQSWNANSTSLSLYSGPDPGYPGRVVYGDSRPAGWLLTGDAPLSAVSRFASWSDTFKFVRNNVGLLMLPIMVHRRNSMPSF